MRAMVLPAPGVAPQLQERADPVPGDGEIRVRVSACGVCRTDLHVVDGELPGIRYPVIPGHEIVGRVDLLGRNVTTHRVGDRVGIPWLGYTCGVCRFCKSGMENLCDRPLFTGYTRDGGFATHTIADARYAFPLPETADDVSLAPLLCAGLIGWRSLVMTGEAKRLGIYGFGAAGHIVAQVALWQGREVYAFTRAGDNAAQAFARKLGAAWAGASGELPDAPLDGAIIYAPAGELVPAALRAVRKGGRVICAGIHMSDIPSFPYRLLWEERQLVSVANLTRQDGLEFLEIAPKVGIRTQTTAFPLAEANDVLDKLRNGQILAQRFSSPEVDSRMAVSIPAECEMQERVFAFLADPDRHPDVQRIDTHGASVFLEGKRALKIKRAVRFPFLDYSTLDKRKAACEEEIKINRPFAPQIYHRVLPVTQNREGSLEIDGGGTPVEFAVEMTRFDERQTFDHLAAAGPLDLALIDAAAEAIAASHRRAPPAAAEPWIRSIPDIVKGNSAALQDAACFPADEIADLERASLVAFAQIKGVLEKRGAQGFVRRCHGDLHLANIVLIDRQPVLFDAIEFDPLIASTDILYDLAFAIMDFLKFGRPAAANALLNKYLALMPFENIDALSTLPLFMSLRSAIRAHVMLARINRNARARAEIMPSTRAYFDLARQLIHPAAPTLVAIGGLSGTGKSVLARALAPAVLPQPGAVVVRTDVLRKQHFRIKETERLPEAAYRPEMNERIYEALLRRASRILVQGHSVVVDAVFARPAERSAIAEVARELNVRFSGLFLSADLATRQQRIGRRETDASDSTPEIARLQEEYDVGTIDWAVVDASGTPEQTLQKCLPQVTRLGAPTTSLS